MKNLFTKEMLKKSAIFRKAVAVTSALAIVLGIVLNSITPYNANAEETVTGGACGAEGNENNVTWSLDGGVFTISGTGAMADWVSGDGGIVTTPG